MRKNSYRRSLKKLLKRITREYNDFHKNMMKRSPQEIYDKCNIIYFYECVYEYFLEKKIIKPEYVYACMKESDVFAALHKLYMKYEGLKFDTWEDIDGLLECLVYNQKTYPRAC